MSRIITMPLDCGMKFNGYKITDHNRSPISVAFTRIENKKRMADGTLRTFVVSTKRQIKVSWSKLPRTDLQTIEHGWGALSLASFYKTTNLEFNLTLTYGDKTTETFKVLWGDFTMKLSNRSLYTDFYDIDITLDEV